MQSSNNSGTRHSGELTAMVAINEDIKEVMRIANEINLAAINAMLISKKIGKSSSGFGVVSSELRAFSRALGEAMHILMTHVSELVIQVAGMIRLGKTLQLQQALGTFAMNRQYLEAVLAHKTRLLAEAGSALRRQQDQFASAIAHASKLCVMGLALSYSAKIEAVYGESQAAALKQVAEGVEQAIASILRTLGRLEKQLEGA